MNPHQRRLQRPHQHQLQRPHQHRLQRPQQLSITFTRRRLLSGTTQSPSSAINPKARYATPLTLNRLAPYPYTDWLRAPPISIRCRPVSETAPLGPATISRVRPAMYTARQRGQCRYTGWSRKATSSQHLLLSAIMQSAPLATSPKLLPATSLIHKIAAPYRCTGL